MTILRTVSQVALTLSLLPALSHAQAPHSAEAYEDLIAAERMLQNGHLGTAEEVLTEVLLVLPDSATAWYKLALTQKLQGNTAAAAISARRALACKPGYTEALLLSAEALVDSDPLSAKKAALQALPDLDSNSPLFRKALEVLVALREFEDALPPLKKAIIANPTDQRLLHMIADISLSTGNLNTATSALRRIAQLNPYDPGPSESLARALIVMGKPNEAIAAFKKSLRIHPSNTEARGKMIELLHQVGADPEDIQTEKRYLEYYKTLKGKLAVKRIL